MSFLSRRRPIYHRPSFTRGSEMPRSGGKAESASSLSRGSSGVVRSCTHHLFIGSDPATFDRAAFTSCGVVPNIPNWPIPREKLIESTPPSIYLPLLLPPGFMALGPAALGWTKGRKKNPQVKSMNENNECRTVGVMETLFWTVFSVTKSYTLPRPQLYQRFLDSAFNVFPRVLLAYCSPYTRTHVHTHTYIINMHQMF